MGMGDEERMISVCHLARSDRHLSRYRHGGDRSIHLLVRLVGRVESLVTTLPRECADGLDPCFDIL
jgi:hypothetical protein